MATRSQRRAKAHAKKVSHFLDKHYGLEAKEAREAREAIVKANRHRKISDEERAWLRVQCSTGQWMEGYSPRGANKMTLSIDKSRIR